MKIVSADQVVVEVSVGFWVVVFSFQMMTHPVTGVLLRNDFSASFQTVT